jgi:F-type H+-transporting ATPase subunit b
VEDRRKAGPTIFRKGVLLCVVFLLAIGVSTAFSSSDGGHGEAAPKGWVATDTYRVMNFAVLAIALFFLLRKPVSQALGSRVQSIREQLTDLENKKREAEKALAEYEAKIANLDDEAKKIVEEYIQQGKEAKERIIKEAESAADKLEEQAKRNIEHEFAMAKKRLQEEVLEKAIAKAEEIIRQRITDEDQERLVDEYLEKVVA